MTDIHHHLKAATPIDRATYTLKNFAFALGERRHTFRPPDEKRASTEVQNLKQKKAFHLSKATCRGHHTVFHKEHSDDLRVVPISSTSPAVNLNRVTFAPT